MRADPTGAVLADGTRVDDLIDRDARTLSVRVHADAEVFELELEKVFARAWIPVAHTSEFAVAGDFVTRYIGRDPVVVSLDGDGAFHVMLNVCTHRGAPVCRAEVGNTLAHKCPFHGWAFAPDGELLGVPFERLVYGKALNKSELGLRQARVGVVAGVIFANWDADAPGLDEFLGDYKFYMESQLARSNAGLEVAGPPQRYVVEANWKIVAEGFYADAYHVLTVHRSFPELGKVTTPSDTPLYGFKASINGHSILCFDYERFGITGEPRQVLKVMLPPGMPEEMLGELDNNLSEDQISLLASTPPSIAALFPSTAIVMIGGGPSGEVGQTVTLRFFVPLSPHKTEIVSFSLVERDAPAEFKEQIHAGTARSFGFGGLFEADDVEVWAGVQRGVHGVIGRRMVDNYQAVGVPRDPDPTRPGTTFRGVSSDDNQWLFYQRYFDYLGDRAW